jgi:cytochrome c oxidase subunit 2
MTLTPLIPAQPTSPVWLDLLVGVVLTAMVVFGSLYIYELNNDAREQELDNALAMRGQTISTDLGCVACHTLDGSLGVGPSWLGMWGRSELLTNGNTVVVDEAYFIESLRDPGRKLVEGYPNVMLRYFLAEEDIAALIEFAKQLSVETAQAE